jgi:hypothetical protein
VHDKKDHDKKDHHGKKHWDYWDEKNAKSAYDIKYSKLLLTIIKLFTFLKFLLMFYL